jgi:hypothetical protein
MAALMIPPVVNVRDIVVGLAPIIAPDANSADIQQSIFLVQRLVFLCNVAQSNRTAALFFEKIIQTMVPNGGTTIVDD